MTKEQKYQMIEDLKVVLNDSAILYLADISGLNASDTSNLRRECYKNDIQLKVVKNTLLKKAMEMVEAKDYDELYDVLKGNTAIMISPITANLPAKIIKTFRKKSDKPLLKGAWIDTSVYVGDEQLDNLANLKSKEELLGEVIGLLQSPAKNVISALKSSGGTIAGLVKTLSER